MYSGVGGIFRIHPNGDVPDDNPFAGESAGDVDKWFAYGFRDGSGLAFDPVTEALWFTERGPGLYDEVNHALPGMNSGWPLIMGPDNRDVVFDANDNVPANKRDLVEIPGSEYADPVFAWAESAGITGLAFLDTANYGSSVRGHLVVGDAAGDLHLFALQKRQKRRDRLVLKGPVRDKVSDSEVERVPRAPTGSWGCRACPCSKAESGQPAWWWSCLPMTRAPTAARTTTPATTRATPDSRSRT